MRSFEQYNEICKYSAKGKQKDNDANKAQQHLQLQDLSIGEYLTDKYALWLDFRTIDENTLHGTGGRIENTSEGITLQIEKKAESAGAPKGYIYLIMDTQLNIKDGAFHSINYQEYADDARAPYGAVCGSDWGWKNTFCLGFTRSCIL